VRETTATGKPDFSAPPECFAEAGNDAAVTMRSISIWHWVILIVVVAMVASPILGIVRGVKNGAVIHVVVSVLVPAYGLIYFFAARRSPRSQVMIWRVVVAFLVGVACALLASLAILTFFMVHPYCCSRFDASEWKQAGQGTDWQVTEKEMKCLRGPMLDDLRWRHLKSGMSKEDLISLLGPYTQSINDLKNNCYTYSVGYCRGLGFDLNFISFCFDADGRLLDTQGKGRF
jgi:hypothetical protein